MPRPHRNFLNIGLTARTSGPNPTDPRLATPPQTPLMDNNNKENVPPPRPHAVRVIPMQPPPLRAVAPTTASGPAAAHSRSVSQIGMSNPSTGVEVGMTNFRKHTFGAGLWMLPRPVTPPIYVNKATGLWGTDTTRVFVAPTIWEHPSSECLLLTAEQDEEMRDGGESRDAQQLQMYDCGMETGHRNLLFSRFGRRC